MPKLLVVDDEPTICYAFAKVFGSGSIEVITASTLAEARSRYEEQAPDILVLDLQLPDGSGLDFFEEVRARNPKRPVIFLTAQGTSSTAIEAMKRGAFDYLTKPIDLERISLLLPQAFEAARLMQSPVELPDDGRRDRLIGRGRAMQEMCKSIGRFAAQDVNVLILGESGTGKELVARTIYSHSRRAKRPFLAINCAALPEHLVESELFGHERGAFTGAEQQRIGKFEQCDGGTLLLDEIGDMPLPAQAKILRLLQEQRFERLGGQQLISTDVRILAATNQNLEKLIAEGRFRNDLYYRLQSVTLSVPPLRARSEDIPELAHHFLYAYGRELNRDVRGFSPEALDRLQEYSWPGNVRELQGAIKSAVLYSFGQTIRAEHLTRVLSKEADPGAEELLAPAFHSNLRERIESLMARHPGTVYATVIAEVERTLLTLALRQTRGHQGQASELLGLYRATLRSKIRELGLSVEKIIADPTTDAEGKGNSNDSPRES